MKVEGWSWKVQVDLGENYFQLAKKFSVYSKVHLVTESNGSFDTHIYKVQQEPTDVKEYRT